MPDGGTISMKPKPRFRFRAVAVLVALVFVPALVGHGVFRRDAGRALRADVESLRASGERVLPHDFAPADPSPRHNAAPDLTAAAAIVNDESEEAISISWVPSTVPVDPRALPYLDRARAWFEPALRRIERARRRPVYQWNHRLESPVLHMLLPELNGLRALSTLVWSAALVEHFGGRHDLVILRLREALYLADVCEPTPAPVAHLVALAINDGTAERIESMAPSLKIGAGGPAAGEASRAEVRALIAVLLDETSIAAGFRTSNDAQRMYDVDAFDHLARGADLKASAVARYMFAPALDINTRRVLNRMTRAVEATRGTSDWPTTAARLDQVGPLEAYPANFPTYDSVPAMRRAAERHFACLTDRRLAATALAVRLYRFDHAGQWPGAIQDLIPAYLPAVPIDAMASDGQPIRYLPSPNRAAVYSVGENGADDRGDESATPGEYGEIGAWRRMDRVFYLGGQARERIYVERPGAVLFGPDVGRPPWEESETEISSELTSTTQPATPE